MSDPSHDAERSASFSNSSWREYEDICDAFDSAWRSGERPSIRKVLAILKRPVPRKLFRHLLEIEIEYRRRAGEEIDIAEYHRRFPKCTNIIEQVLADSDVPPSPPHEVTTRDLPTAGESLGSVLGRYKLQQQLGVGGFGVVYLAEQQEPVRRRVALKIIKLGMDTRQVIARFEAERQALALMDHPHIAKVLDAGATDSGRPYFVMELVKGIPVTDYCDQHHISLEDRLALFMQVCAAVQHAHQKGIIHRDIKPSNVLVAHVDNQPMPKVIDFGIAKATDHRLTEQTVFTELGQFIGTPAYMSPEQTEVQALDIDTRSDIYSLGVLLYELLTGSTPFDVKKLAAEGASFEEIRKMICEQEPSKPSAKLSTLGNEATTVARRRGMESARLTSMLRGDLDWIVMKALEKVRRRRYGTATALAEDIGRFLSDEPIQARPPSRRYRMAKYIQRNKGLVASLSAIAALLWVAVAGTTWGMVNARHQQAIADAESARKQKVVDTFVAAFRSPDLTNQGVTSQMTALQVLEQALATIENDVALQQDPLARATLLKAIASSLESLGEYEKAVSAFELSRKLRSDELGDLHRDTLAAARRLGDAYRNAGRFDEAVQLLESTVDHMQRHLGMEATDTVAARLSLANAYHMAGRLDEAIELHESLKELTNTKLGIDHQATLTGQSDLAATYLRAGRYEEAIALAEDVTRQSQERLGADHPHTLIAMNNLAAAHNAAGHHDDAIAIHEEVLRLGEAKLGPNHPSNVQNRGNLGVDYMHAGRWQEALPLLEEALQHGRDRLGSEHPGTMTCMGNLAGVYSNLGRHHEALELLQESLKLRLAHLGAHHVSTIGTMHNLAECYRRTGRLRDAIELSEETLKLWQAALGPDHPNTLMAMNNLAAIYKDVQPEKALPLAEKTLRLTEEKLGELHLETLRCRHNLADTHLQAGKRGKAERLSKEVEELTRTNLGEDHPLTLASRTLLASVYRDKRQLDRACALYSEVLARYEAKLGADHQRTLVTRGNLARVYHELGQSAQAISMYEEVLPMLKNQVGPQHQHSLQCQINLADANRAQGHNKKARALLEEAVTLAAESLGEEHRISRSCKNLLASLDAERDATGNGL